MSVIELKTTGIIGKIDLKKPHIKALYWILFSFSMVVVFVSMFPPLWIMFSSLKSTKEFFAIPPTLIPQSFHPEKIVTIWNEVNFARYTLNSLIMLSGSVVCGILVNGLTAYGLSILKPKGSKFILSLILWSMMVPATISIVPLFTNIVNLNLLNSYVPLWLSYGCNAFWVVVFKSFFDSLPKSFIEAARIDGANSMTIFFRIVLPLSKAACGVVAIFSANTAWSDFLLPYLVLKNRNLQTMVVKIFLMRSDGTLPVDYTITALLFTIIPPVILFAIFQKQIIGGMTVGGVKG